MIGKRTNIRKWAQLALAGVVAGVSAFGVQAANPPKNPYLAKSSFPLPHGDSAQTTSAVQAGPTEPGTKFLSLFTDDITYVASGPFQFGSYTSGPYPDGRRVMWSSGGDRVVKWDHDTLDVIAQYKLPPKTYRNAGQGEKHINLLNVMPLPVKFIYMLTELVPMLTDLSGIYSLIDSKNQFYVAGQVDEDGSQGITVYGDVDRKNPDSMIEIKREWRLPPEITGSLVGMNMTFDGRIVLVTEHGWVMTVERDFSDWDAIRMIYDADEDPYACAGAGFCWVRNSFAVDKDGGIYILSNDHAHKVVWDGTRLSTDEADGAWRARYSNNRGYGSGSTPSLMGFNDDRDQFVVFTDGDELMNVTLMWRNGIPSEWVPPEGAPSHRIAGMLPSNMGPLGLEKVQTEQSVVINGYGAMVVNNEPRNLPEELGAIDPRLNALVVGFLGNEPNLQPYGLQKFKWSPEKVTDKGKVKPGHFKVDWVNTDVSSLNGVPIVSKKSKMVYTVGARNGLYTIEALDWRTGEEVFHWFVGGNRFNTLYAGILINENGDIHYNTLWGKALFRPQDSNNEFVPQELMSEFVALIDNDPQQAMDILSALSEEDARELFELFDPSVFASVIETLGPFGIEDISYDLKSLLLKLPE